MPIGQETTAPPAPIIRRLKPTTNRFAISTAVEKLLDDGKSCGLTDSTRGKLKTLCERQLLKWVKKESLIQLDELATANLTGFRSGWKDGALPEKRERLMDLFGFALIAV